jgi:hypothetical protein
MQIIEREMTAKTTQISGNYYKCQASFNSDGRITLRWYLDF